MNARTAISTASLLTAGGFVLAVAYLHARMNAPEYGALVNLVRGDAEAESPALVMASSTKDARKPTGSAGAGSSSATLREFAVTQGGPVARDRGTTEPETNVSAPSDEPARRVRRETVVLEVSENRIASSAGSTHPSVQGAGEKAMVVEVQTYLKKEGYYEGALDGIPGPKTRAAIRAFESDMGWAESGRIRSGLLIAIRRR